VIPRHSVVYRMVADLRSKRVGMIESDTTPGSGHDYYDEDRRAPTFSETTGERHLNDEPAMVEGEVVTQQKLRLLS
jgi:hypothetical protein